MKRNTTVPCLILSAALSIPLSAQTTDPVVRVFQYSAKFVCTANIPGTSAADSAVVPGVYATMINLHNPTAQGVAWPGFRMKIAVAAPAADLTAGPVSAWISPDLALRSDGALQVNCRILTSRFGITPIEGFEGFLVIQSPVPLDVTAVYTAGSLPAVPGSAGAGASISVVQINERILNTLAGCDAAARDCRVPQ